MKKLTAKQIDQIKEVRSYNTTNFHGNTKKVGALLVEDLKAIILKKREREYRKADKAKKSNIQIVKELIELSQAAKGTTYFKTLIEGNNGIYYASPVFGHGDYNKSRVFAKNEQTLKLMQIFNALIK